MVRPPQIRSALDVNPLFFIGIVIGIFMTWAFQNTRAGLVVRIVGDSADAARAMGLRINLVRFAATATGGALAGIGGAFLSLFYPGSWNEGLSSGQGLIAVALVDLCALGPACAVSAPRSSSAPPARLAPRCRSVGVTPGLLSLQCCAVHADARSS